VRKECFNKIFATLSEARNGLKELTVRYKYSETAALGY